jgi:hypothetical protein
MAYCFDPSQRTGGSFTTKCGLSPRFASIGWDKSVAWCSYTATRRRLPALTFAGLIAAMDGLGLEFCGGTEDLDDSRRFILALA